MGDLIAIPRYGWLYRVDLECGHQVLTQDPEPFYTCWKCGGKLSLYPSWETIRNG